MKEYRNSYSYGSVAYNLEPELQRDDRVNKFDIRVERRRGLSKKNPLAMLGLYASVSAVVFCVVMLLIQYVTISYNQKTITDLKAEIKTIEDEIYNVEVQTAETLDMANVKKVAIGKLGMVVPQDNQVMYISVPNEDYTVNY